MTDEVKVTIEGVERTFPLNAKVFRTKSTGYHAFGKLPVGEKKFQINVIAVLIGSKPEAAQP